MVILGGEDVLIGPGPERDKAEAEAARKATLRAMGIKPLSPYSSPMMDAPPLVTPRYGSRYTPRKAARAAGDLYYFPLRPCVRGHTSKRFTASANCAACLDIYRLANVDKVRKHSRESHQRARDRRKAEL